MFCFDLISIKEIVLLIKLNWQFKKVIINLSLAINYFMSQYFVSYLTAFVLT